MMLHMMCLFLNAVKTKMILTRRSSCSGGYNFANCWSTGYVAGTSAAAFVQELRGSEKAKMR